MKSRNARFLKDFVTYLVLCVSHQLRFAFPPLLPHAFVQQSLIPEHEQVGLLHKDVGLIHPWWYQLRHSLNWAFSYEKKNILRRKHWQSPASEIRGWKDPLAYFPFLNPNQGSGMIMQMNSSGLRNSICDPFELWASKAASQRSLRSRWSSSLTLKMLFNYFVKDIDMLLLPLTPNKKILILIL